MDGSDLRIFDRIEVYEHSGSFDAVELREYKELLIKIQDFQMERDTSISLKDLRDRSAIR